jgi:hypothetical protein
MATIETTLPGGEVYSARAPNSAEWSRFIAHNNSGNERVGWRELAQVCCTSHSVDEATTLVTKYPGAIRPIGEAIVELSTGEDDAKIEGDEVALADMRFRAPTLEEWDDFQDKISAKGVDHHAASLALLETLSLSPGKITTREAEHPGDVELTATAVSKVAGMRIKIAVKKG